MIKQPLQPNLQNRSHVYYPIETKRAATEVNNAPQPTLRIEKIRERQIDTLRRQNEELREREEIYIDKLMKLEEGLENQHSEFIKLQELYTELFESYKQKETEIIELEMKFRESDRYREQERQTDHEKPKDSFRSTDSRAPNYSFREKEWRSKQEEWQMKEQQMVMREKDWQAKQKELNQYIETINKKMGSVTDSYERIVQELSSQKGRDKANTMRAISEKTLGELQEWQKQLDGQKQNRLKFQYENQFLKSRNADLETQREELEKLLAYKQKQINKLREQKIKIHRQSSQKFIQRSPNKSVSKGQIKHSAVSERQPQKDSTQLQNVLNASLDLGNNQYFSFSRQRQEYSIDSELPSFPPELQIDSLITEYKK